VKDFAELAHYYLEHDSPHEVIAFSVHRNYLPEGSVFRGLPVVAFEDVQNVYPPGDHMFFAPMSPKNMNREREKIFNEIKRKGYSLISYLSSGSTSFGNEIGENCFILERVVIQPFVEINSIVVLWSGAVIAHHSIIHDHVSITSSAVVSGHCDIGTNCFIGANSTIRNGLRIAEGTFVGMAASVISDTEAWAAYKGNPAIKLSIPSSKMRL
jgi:sugar O-acyltransferase (sialic acid O-acetyltransferase NeuD family)